MVEIEDLQLREKIFKDKVRCGVKGWIIGLSFAAIISLLPYSPNPMQIIYVPIILWIVAVASMFAFVMLDL